MKWDCDSLGMKIVERSVCDGCNSEKGSKRVAKETVETVDELVH